VIADTTTVIAIYAAAVATAGLIWQIVSRVAARRTVVRVRVAPGLVTPGVMGPGVGDVVIIMSNRSDHPVRITSAGLRLQDGSKRELVMLRPISDGTLPQVVPSHDAHQVYMDLRELQGIGIDFHRPIVAWARTSDDHQFTSKATTLFS
jgi:hypothetical protein